MKVVQIVRKPNGLGFSLEQVFEDIRKELPADIDVETYVNPYFSRGIWPRFAGMIRVMWHQGNVNHITGDVHFMSIFLSRRKTILTIHDCATLERLSGWKYWMFRFFWYWLPAKRAAAITVISESAKRELLKHLGKGNWPIIIIPDFVSPEFKFSRKSFDSTCPVILQVGTTENKNIERVAVALRGLCCKLVIIGKLTSKQYVALEENEIFFENHYGISRKSVIDHYRKCDLVMFASLYEGFGLPILEGQAIGRPVITSNCYSMPEVGGEGAYYVDPYDEESIRNAVNSIFESKSLVEKLVEAGLKNVRQYKISVIAAKYAELYRYIHRVDEKASK
ncbi:glycosyltransferase family 1 protein [Haliea sp. E1-2-M8]|uniref:glycosyltransferase family 4 protein n=1 Tax=Haliea sp. E1-2-M8 TaxID=3064706 RepID=UPI00271CAAD8|nr:glycosyltransferase family 1 protein [Haliea sp. E1-2-M8]MDO8861669.1 glycosyltransferase family 1 protein [Haliea sp. E1-2-M8]